MVSQLSKRTIDIVLNSRSEQTSGDCIPSRLQQIYRRLHILSALRGFQLLQKPFVLFLNGVHFVEVERSSVGVMMWSRDNQRCLTPDMKMAGHRQTRELFRW